MSAELPDEWESSTVGIPFFPGTMGGVMKSDIEGRAPGSPDAQDCYRLGRPGGLGDLKTSRLIWMYSFMFDGTSSSGKIAVTGHSGSHAPQSMHSSGWMKSWSGPS